MSQIPIELTEKQFEEHVNPYLSKAKRGFVCQISLHKVFNYILYWLHTGCQWERLPIDKNPVSEKKKSATAPFTITFSSGVTIIA
jgi:transposase